MEEGYLWAAIHRDLELSQGSLLKFFRHFRCARTFLKATPEQLAAVPGITERVYRRILERRNSIDPARLKELLRQRKIRVTLLGEAGYPRLLAEITDPPVILYSTGQLPSDKVPLLAVVGARQATPYGRAIAAKLSGQLGQLGWGIVSGMARGIDTAAHEGILTVGGYTVAVLGCGVDRCYPRENIRLYRQIADQGCLLSEFPPETQPLARNFPVRNRIISGLSLGTLVIEAGSKSGSLITASFALQQGRDVFAVPGPITSARSDGCHQLIKEGAKLVANIEDLIEEFPYLELQQPKTENNGEPDLTEQERLVWQQLSCEPQEIDQVAAIVELPVAVVGGILTMLEFKGLARCLPGQLYVNRDIIKK